MPVFPRRRTRKMKAAMMRMATRASTRISELDPDEEDAGAELAAEVLAATGDVAALVGGAVVADARRGLVVRAGAAAWRALSGSMMP